MQVCILIKAVATDVDGTITDDKSILSIAAICAIRDLERRGIRVMLCSGNALCVLKTLARYIGCTGPSIAENGAVIEYKGKIKIIGEKGLARRAVGSLKEEYGDKIKEAWSNVYRNVDAAILRTLELKDVETVVQRFKGLKVIDSGFAYHIIDSRIDKGVGVAKAAKWIGIEKGDMAGVGDSVTDCELLSSTSFKCAVANAPPELRKIADTISAAPYGEGFAEIAQAIIGKNGCCK